MSDREIHLKITGDGSHTLFVPELNENYHSWHGAYSESVHVFIEQGLKKAAEKFEEVRIFEVGFGTGLNAILSYDFAKQHQHIVHYTGIEKHPLDIELVSQLNYPEKWKNPFMDQVFQQMHQAPWNDAIRINEFFSFKKLQGSVLEYMFDSGFYQLIFFDAFAPEKQPEMWTKELFSKLYTCLQPGGMLVTYCAKGQFKRDLRSAGFEVETLPGPPGKREMVRGVKMEDRRPKSEETKV